MARSVWYKIYPSITVQVQGYRALSQTVHGGRGTVRPETSATRMPPREFRAFHDGTNSDTLVMLLRRLMCEALGSNWSFQVKAKLSTSTRILHRKRGIWENTAQKKTLAIDPGIW